MKKIKLILQVVTAVAAILLLNHLNGTFFELPLFLERWLNIALVFVHVLAAFAFMKFIDIMFALFDSVEEQAHDEN